MVAFLKCRTKCLQNVINTLVYFVYLLLVSAVVFVCLVHSSSCVCSLLMQLDTTWGRFLFQLRGSGLQHLGKILCVKIQWEELCVYEVLGGSKCLSSFFFMFSSLISIFVLSLGFIKLREKQKV